MKCIKKSFSILMVLTVVGSLLTGCQQNPDSAVVISKNDGRFDANAVISASESNEPDATQEVHNVDSFFSTDESVEFNIQIDNTLTKANMPVLEVVPHYITEAEVKTVAHALFGNAVFYEWQHWKDEEPTKSEIQAKINRWSEFTNQEAIDALWGVPKIDSVPVVKMFIDEYTKRLESAQEKNNKEECQWTYKKAPYYLFSAEEAMSYNSTKEDDMIKATLNVNGVPFTFQAGSRNQDDYKANYFRAYIESDSPLGIDKRYYTAKLCRTEKPTSDQISAVLKKAETILSEMDLGEWIINNYEVSEVLYGDTQEFTIIVNAVPSLMGIPTIHQALVSNLTASDVYSSNYQISNCQFQFSANGDLIYFTLDSPIDIKEVINENVAVISISELLDLAKNNLKHSSFFQYDTQMQTDPESKNVKCKIYINETKYALARIRVPDTEENYYYVPSLTIYGDAEFYNKTTDEFYFSNNGLTLLSLNAVDGTIINATNG